MRKSSSGFTIVELLIVIVVIGILAAITTVAFNGIQRSGRNTARIQTTSTLVSNLKILQSAKGTDGVKALMIDGSQCIGTAYPDVDPRPAYSCRYAEYNSPVSIESSPPNQPLYDDISTLARYVANYEPVTQTAFSNVDRVISSAPFLIYSRTAVTGAAYQVDGGPNMNTFTMLSYRLEGPDMECKLRPILRQVASSPTIQYTTGHRNSVTNGGATECWLWLDSIQ